MPRIGPMELGIILVIVLIIFGVGRLPQVGGAFGKSIRAFRRGQAGKELDDESSSEPKEKTVVGQAKSEADEEG